MLRTVLFASNFHSFFISSVNLPTITPTFLQPSRSMKKFHPPHLHPSIFLLHFVPYWADLNRIIPVNQSQKLLGIQVCMLSSLGKIREPFIQSWGWKRVTLLKGLNDKVDREWKVGGWLERVKVDRKWWVKQLTSCEDDYNRDGMIQTAFSPSSLSDTSEIMTHLMFWGAFTDSSSTSAFNSPRDIPFPSFPEQSPLSPEIRFNSQRKQFRATFDLLNELWMYH